MDNQANDRHQEVQEGQLKRALSPLHVLGLSMSDASPVMAVVLLSVGIFSVGGSFAVVSCLILTFVIIMIALNLAELASQYPLTGGMYSLTREVLPKGPAWIAMFNFCFQGVFIPASLCLGIGQFALDLMPGLPLTDQAIAVIMLVLAMILATMNVEAGAKSTIVLMCIQAVVLTVIVAAAVLHPNNSLVQLISAPVVLRGGALIPVTAGIMMATLVPTFSVINGYDAVLGFSEELKGGPKTLAKTVIAAGILASLLITIPLVASMVAAPSLLDFFSTETSVVYAVRETLGPAMGTLVNVGVIIALFNATMTLMMYFGRAWYASARDGLWSPGINRFFGKLNKRQVPGNAVIFLLICSIVLTFVSSLNWLIIFSGTMICVVYFFIGVSGLVNRIKFKDRERPYSMPLWPIPSIIVTLFTGFSIVTQEVQYLIGEIVMASIALICHFIFSRINKDVSADV